LVLATEVQRTQRNKCLLLEKLRYLKDFGGNGVRTAYSAEATAKAGSASSVEPSRPYATSLCGSFLVLV
jgi:hypothetical protein